MLLGYSNRLLAFAVVELGCPTAKVPPCLERRSGLLIRIFWGMSK